MKAELFTAKVAQNGRITIPKYYRDAKEIKDGDVVVCHIGKVKELKC